MKIRRKEKEKKRKSSRRRNENIFSWWRCGGVGEYQEKLLKDCREVSTNTNASPGPFSPVVTFATTS